MGGVGGGKTAACVDKAFVYCVEHPGARGLLTEPTFPLVRDVLLPSIRERWGAVEGILWTFKAADYNIEFVNGSLLLLRSALMMHPQFLAGLNLAFFGMDEAALGDQEATFLALQARLRQQDMLHQGWVTGTPKGRNWVWRRWEEKPTDAYRLHHVRTADNPVLPVDYLLSLQESYGQTPFAQQELEGRFVAFGGLIYPQFQLGGSGHVQEPLAGPYKEVAAGVDFGITAPSVITVYAQAGNGRVYGLDEFYQRRCPIEDLLKAAVEFQKVHHPYLFYCDPSGKEEIEQMRRIGLPVAPAPIKDVLVGIQLVSALLNKQMDGRYGIYYSPKMVNTIAEKQQYQWKERRPGSSDYKDEPVKENDHCMDSERYALTGLIRINLGNPVRCRIA